MVHHRHLTSGPDGALWFAAGNYVGRITTDGFFYFFTTGATSADIAGVAAGSDGNIWFTEEREKSIGRLTPTGTVTTFQVPITNPNAYPWFIVAGRIASTRR
jgi:virginiamycin B lyase